MTYAERWNAAEARWYAEQTDARLACLMAGAWDANDRDGYAKARAEIERRSKGGTMWNHFRNSWGSN